MPARRERAGLGLAVADDAGDEEIRVVERRAEGVRQGVAELTAFVDRAGCLRCDVRRDPARERELAEERAEACFVLRDMGVELRVGALEIRVGDEPRAAVTGAGDIDRGKITRVDRPVQVRVDEVETRRRPEMAEEARLDVLGLERPFQQGVVEQVDLPDRQVVGRPPVGVDQRELVTVERFECCAQCRPFSKITSTLSCS